MRNKDLVNKKLEQIDGQLQLMKVLITRPTTTLEEMNESIKKCEDLSKDIQSMVSREPYTGHDVNPYISN